MMSNHRIFENPRATLPPTRVKMKRVFVFLAVIALSYSVFAPLKTNAQTTVGFRAGLNLATFGGTDPRVYGHHTAVNVGAFLDLPLSERVGLRLGAGYSGKGAERTYGDVTGEVETRIGYLEIPALLRLRVSPGSSVSAHLLLGPALSFKVSCEVETDAPIWGGTSECGDAGLDVRETDLGATGGIGVEIELSEGLTLVGESLYTLGLRTVGESGDGVKNRAFSLTLGVAYPIG